MIVRTLETTPRDATHWSTPSLAAEVGPTKSAVHRIWRAFGLQPHRQETLTHLGRGGLVPGNGLVGEAPRESVDQGSYGGASVKRQEGIGGGSGWLGWVCGRGRFPGRARAEGPGAWVETWNNNPKPLDWTKTAEEILDSIARYCNRINESRH